MATRDWSNLTADILSSIADRLGLIELLSFRGICKHWHSSSFSASDLIESSPEYKPWLLLYGLDKLECKLYTKTRFYPICIPEMHGATCIASNQGWLLLFKKGFVFFFCPFSRARIDLPNFPQTEISGHVAAFSTPPTSVDCIVSVINHCDQDNFELNLITRGAKTWTKHKYRCSSQERFDKTITCASFINGIFCFLDCKKGVLAYIVNANKFVVYQAREVEVRSPYSLCSPPILSASTQVLHTRRYYKDSNVRELLGWDDDITFSICGTRKQCCWGDTLITNETVKATEDGNTRSAKGVWIEPRFFQVPPDQSW